ncbi:3-deoxy-D-manno-octulosonic acid transferase [uncultured Roseibium sp.]|uniref:3-deoxy-D-manno-octulosonic acid transferase n=1 Tax=uncultured Roseibium sp. TaxID=1936171 RepID=UPI00261128BD|nr:3-deoxy-D-manno-octulosonic acid transferase [uncultured Roseibium sp.]
MADRRPALVTAYRVLAVVLTPLFHFLFWLRSRSGKEVPHRKCERFGTADVVRPEGQLVWIHAASVGETVSVLPLVDALIGNGSKVLLTTVTVTAAELAEKRLPADAIHQFMPFDAPAPIARFLDSWRPDLAMVVESEIWPCLFDELRHRPIPFLLVNGRLSDKSHRNWSILRGVARYLFQCLDFVLAQSEADADRFRHLGCSNVGMPGNLKFDAEEPILDEATFETMKVQLGQRPVWLAALTHPGEDDYALDAFDKLRSVYPDLLLILVPRHPARADQICEVLQSRGLTYSRRSSGGKISPEIQVYLGDTLGEMGLFYRLAPVTFLGGSYTEAGGHNPVEAALCGSALVTGPRVSNARAVYKDFWKHGAALRVSSPENLGASVEDLFKDPEAAEGQAARARELVEAGRGALDKTLEALGPYLKTTDTAGGAA